MDIPIDPSLLELGEGGDPFGEEVDQIQSSGDEDDDQDGYFEDEEDGLREIEPGPSRRNDEDAVFR